MQRSVFVQGFVSALPRYFRPQREALQWLAAAHARAWAAQSGREDMLEDYEQRMTQMVRRYACGENDIGWRRSDIPDFMHTDWRSMEVFNFEASPRGSGLTVRNQIYASVVRQAVESLFPEELIPPSDLLHVSCTGYISPSPVQRLIDARRWNTLCQATQLHHMGCYAAVPALRIAEGFLCRRDEDMTARVDVVHTEMCTLHFDPAEHSPEQLVVQSLFADGYIRYSVVPPAGRSEAPALELLAISEETIPGSSEDMTWTLSEWGFRMTLARQVPEKICGRLPAFLDGLFFKASLDCREQAGSTVFAVHPGGPRILNSVQDLLRLDAQQLQASRAVLFQRGNMSSATLPHIWMAAVHDASIKPGTLLVSLAFGPGLTIAGALFRKC